MHFWWFAILKNIGKRFLGYKQNNAIFIEKVELEKGFFFPIFKLSLRNYSTSSLLNKPTLINSNFENNLYCKQI